LTNPNKKEIKILIFNEMNIEKGSSILYDQIKIY